MAETLAEALADYPRIVPLRATPSDPAARYGPMPGPYATIDDLRAAYRARLSTPAHVRRHAESRPPAFDPMWEQAHEVEHLPTVYGGRLWVLSWVEAPSRYHPPVRRWQVCAMDDDGIVWPAGVYGFGDFQGYVGTNVFPSEVWAARFAAEEAERAAKLWGSYEPDDLRAMPTQPAISPAIGDADLKINLGRRRVWLTRDDTVVVQDMTRSGWTLESVDAAEPVGLVEIARRLGVARGTVDQWRTRGLLPEPRWTVGGRPAWTWADIAEWARQTGRLPDTT